jgi:coproporphyrinogen III oxidase
VNPAAVRDYLTSLQQRIVAKLEELDGSNFRSDSWKRPEGGGGLTRVIEEGNLFERGGVNYSSVHGASLPPSASASRPQIAGRAFEAAGVSPPATHGGSAAAWI